MNTFKYKTLKSNTWNYLVLDKQGFVYYLTLKFKVLYKIGGFNGKT